MPSSRLSPKTQLVLLAFITIFITVIADHFVAALIGYGRPGSTYRRIGPDKGPQVFVAGSSLLQFGLSWPEISKSLGQGMENWGTAGSSPDMWEVSQRTATNSNLMIIGISVYDLNEYHLSDSRANIVPLTQTIQDLRRVGANWKFSRRLLSQYPLAYVRELFPTAGESDAVLVGLRHFARQRLGMAATTEDRDRALVLPSMPVLDFGETITRLSDWPQDKIIRRLSGLQGENEGRHVFNGPKQLAFRRMLIRARNQGRVIVVVLPVSNHYAREFLTPTVRQDFENTLREALHSAPQATVIRLDQVPGLSSDEYFGDFVHLNSAGRDIATPSFLTQLKAYNNLPALTNESGSNRN